MDKSRLDKAIEQALGLKLAAIDKVVADMIEPLSVTNNPEELIGKSFEQWTPQDLTMLKSIYGNKEPNILSNFVFKKTYERVKSLENEEL
jgi:hypothetical protein